MVAVLGDKRDREGRSKTGVVAIAWTKEIEKGAGRERERQGVMQTSMAEVNNPWL